MASVTGAPPMLSTMRSRTPSSFRMSDMRYRSGQSYVVWAEMHSTSTDGSRHISASLSMEESLSAGITLKP